MIEKMIQKVDQLPATLRPEADHPTTASIALELGGIAMRFARVERVPRYDEKTRESDAEHSFMLALVANELAYSLYPHELDRGRIMEYAVAHDALRERMNERFGEFPQIVTDHALLCELFEIDFNTTG